MRANRATMLGGVLGQIGGVFCRGLGVDRGFVVGCPGVWIGVGCVLVLVGCW
jgi:hypothetical protein